MKRAFALVLLATIIISACAPALAPTPTIAPQVTSAPSATLTPTATAVPIPTTTFTRVPTLTVVPPEAPEVRPLLPHTEPPVGVESWQICEGRMDTKGFSFTYRFLYPSDWFSQSGPEGCLQVQSVPPHPGDLSPGDVKVEVSAKLCTSSLECQFRGQPITIGGVKGYIYGYYDETFGLTIYEVMLSKEEAVFQLTILVKEAPIREDHLVLLGYMLSTLVIE